MLGWPRTWTLNTGRVSQESWYQWQTGLLKLDFNKILCIDCWKAIYWHFETVFAIAIMRRLTEAERWRAIGMLQTGSTQVQTANIMNISQSVVSRLWARYQRSGAVADMQRSGRPRSMSRRDDHLVNQMLSNGSLTSTDLQQNLLSVWGVTVCRQTISNRVHIGGLRAWHAQVVLPLKARHRRARLAWFTQCRRWNINQWSHVMFSDESRFTLDFLDRRRRVWRRVGERYTDPARVAPDRYGGGYVMVWGGITMTSKTDLHACQVWVTGVCYRDNVLAPYVILFAPELSPIEHV